LNKAIEECISIKRDIVSNDEFDRGERMILNFGHTLGHAIEKHYNYENFTHGSGVAIGMVMMSEFSEKMNLTQKGTAFKIKTCLEKYNLPTSTGISKQTLLNNALNDKKRTKSVLNIIVIDTIGNAKIHPMAIADLQKTFVEENYES
jgi:3-dehydroquinate synthase